MGGREMLLKGVAFGAIMTTGTGTLPVDVGIENLAKPGKARTILSVLVDTGAELSWLPADVLESLGIERHTRRLFRRADGTILERWTGGALVHVAGKRTADDVVFGEPGDSMLLGARTLAGLNFRVDPATGQLVDAGPAPAAVGIAFDRRRFLQLSALTIAAVLVDSGCSRTDDRGAADHTQLVDILGPERVRELGNHYRAAHPTENTAEALRAAISKRPASHSEDFEAGRTVLVDGWVLSVTEARQAALFSLTPA